MKVVSVFSKLVKKIHVTLFPTEGGKKQTLGQCGDHVSVKMMTLITLNISPYPNQNLHWR